MKKWFTAFLELQNVPSIEKAKILKEMGEIPNSKQNIKRIIKELKEKYPKRKALFQEIEKSS